MQSKAGKRGPSGPGVGAGFFTQWCRQAGLPKDLEQEPLEERE